MKLLVVGHSVFDFIESEEYQTKGAGGIYYTISALNRFCNSKDEIFLCSQIDNETYNYFSPEFEKIKKDYLIKVEKIPRVHLNLSTGKERHEAYENITNNLTTDFKDLKNFDGILINMITGFDINLNQIYEIRNSFSGLIYIDVHTLSRGLGENFNRNFRSIPNSKEWAKNVDIIQANEHEIYTISEKNTEIKVAEELFEFGIRILCITKGEKGAKIYYMKNGEICSYFIAAKKIQNANVIGCGDVFGAAFFYNYILSNNEIGSLKKAVNAAELHVTNKLL
jgi:hypothetical protein